MSTISPDNQSSDLDHEISRRVFGKFEMSHRRGSRCCSFTHHSTHNDGVNCQYPPSCFLSLRYCCVHRQHCIGICTSPRLLAKIASFQSPSLGQRQKQSPIPSHLCHSPSSPARVPYLPTLPSTHCTFPRRPWNLQNSLLPLPPSRNANWFPSSLA